MLSGFQLGPALQQGIQLLLQGGQTLQRDTAVFGRALIEIRFSDFALQRGQLWVSNGTLEVTLDPVVLMGRVAREL